MREGVKRPRVAAASAARAEGRRSAGTRDAGAGIRLAAPRQVRIIGGLWRGSRLPVDEVAHAAGTIGYELMCALARRVPVQVVD